MAKKLHWYIEKYGVEEGTRRHVEIRRKIGLTSRNKNTIEGFIKRYGRIEGTKRFEEFKNKSKHTKENFIKRHGKEKGPIIWQQYKETKSQISIRNKDYWIKLGYSSKEAKELVSSIQQTCSLKSFIEKYGEEEGTNRYLKKNETHSHNISLSGFIEKYGDFEGRKKFKEYCFNKGRTKKQLIEQHGEDYAIAICNSRAHTLKNYIKWYGEENGLIKFSRRYNNLPYGSSKQADEFFEKLYNICLVHGLEEKDIYFSKTSEWFLRNGEKLFWYDFTIPKLKIIIEFNGEHIHPNQNWDEEIKKSWKHAYTKQSFEEVQLYDTCKLKTAKDKGFDVYVIWSKSNLDEEIIKMEERINDRFNQ